MRALAAKWLDIPEGEGGRHLALLLFCAATALLVPLELYLPGALLWIGSAILVARESDRRFRRRMGLLLAVLVILAVAPIHTDRSNGHFVSLAVPFLAVVIVPAIAMARWDPGVIRYRFWPRHPRWRDLIYVILSAPLAWLIIRYYFFIANPELPTHWPMPQPESEGAAWRLFIGINCVGIWDELFFVNTVFALMRSCFSLRVANLAQAVVYSAVLTDMAFTGIGPALIYLFALTQGAMFEGSENLLFVLLVHIIVDAVLVAAILHYHYPGFSLGIF